MHCINFNIQPLSEPNSSLIFSTNEKVNKVALLIKAEGRQSHRSQAIEERSMREKISSFKRRLLKGKWSQNASTNKCAPRDERECVAGRIIHVGEGVMNWKGCRKCAALCMALWKWMGSLKKITLRCPQKHLRPRERTLVRCIGMLVLYSLDTVGSWWVCSFNRDILDWLSASYSHLCYSGNFLLCLWLLGQKYCNLCFDLMVCFLCQSTSCSFERTEVILHFYL